MTHILCHASASQASDQSHDDELGAEPALEPSSTLFQSSSARNYRISTETLFFVSKIVFKNTTGTASHSNLKFPSSYKGGIGYHIQHYRSNLTLQSDLFTV